MMRQHYDTNLHLILSSLSVTDYEAEETEDGLMSLTLEVEPDATHIRPALGEKAEYLGVAREGDVDLDDVVEDLVTDIHNGLDLTFNTVGGARPDDGIYEKINDSQWKQIEEDAQYAEYSDLLWEVTGEDADPETLSIPDLYEPFLRACAESDDHELPPQGTVRPIIRAHIDEVRSTAKAQTATRQLKAELEAAGVRPRTASRVANRFEDSDLLRTDAELEELDEEE